MAQDQGDEIAQLIWDITDTTYKWESTKADINKKIMEKAALLGLSNEKYKF
jgi:hypothetical protein